MCGRFSLVETETEIKHQFGIKKLALNLTRYNIAPSRRYSALKRRSLLRLRQDILAIRNTEVGSQAVFVR